jgi:hypothetical protein
MTYFGNMGDEAQCMLEDLDIAFAAHGTFNKDLASLGKRLDGLTNTVRGPHSFAGRGHTGLALVRSSLTREILSGRSKSIRWFR